MIWVFVLSLGLTLLVELSVAVVWGLRGRELLLCALVNVLTNPVAVLVHRVFPGWPVVALVELAAVLTEGLYYARYGVHRPWRLALTANAVSFSCGLVMNYFL